MSTPDQQRGEERHSRSNKVKARNVVRRKGHSHLNIIPNISTRSENSRSENSRSETSRNGSISNEKSGPPCHTKRCLAI